MNTIQKIYLVGNPNSGKSSLFNQLTGLDQKVANYPGVTTEKKTGVVLKQDQYFEITDLPGCYSLYPNSIDEKVRSDLPPLKEMFSMILTTWSMVSSAVF